LFQAIGELGRVEIDVILTEAENQSFLAAMVNEGYACIDSALANIRSEAATATRKEDLKAIRAIVRSKPGAFSSLNNTVRQHLERWFVSQGAVPSAQRIRAHASHEGSAAPRENQTVSERTRESRATHGHDHLQTVPIAKNEHLGDVIRGPTATRRQRPTQASSAAHAAHQSHRADDNDEEHFGFDYEF
jgi:hypothetical protein